MRRLTCSASCGASAGETGRTAGLLPVSDRELVVHSCPYCGCPDVYLADTDGGGRTVACPSCGMSGPESVDGDDAEAARGWEILCGRMCRHCNRQLVKIIMELKNEKYLHTK